jgi:threonine/homoserine/homoserine lactone efflux protein
MDLQTILTFCAAFAIFAASPGPDNVTIFSKTLSNGAIHGIAYGSGVVASIYCFVLLATAGFSAIGNFLNTNLSFLQYLGAGYLIYMGVSTWRASFSIRPNVVTGSSLNVFLTGFILNISNPKMPFFYLALLPGIFGVRTFSLTDILVILVLITIIEILVIGGHVILALKAKKTFNDLSQLKFINKIAGGLMVGAGVFVASR